MSAATAVADRMRLPQPSRALLAIALAIFAAVVFVLFNGQYTIPHDNDAPFFHLLRDAREWLDANRNTNIVLVLTVTPIRVVVSAVFEVFTLVLHQLTWPGLTTIAGALGLAVGGWRLALLMVGGFLSMGILGLWQRYGQRRGRPGGARSTQRAPEALTAVVED